MKKITFIILLAILTMSMTTTAHANTNIDSQSLQTLIQQQDNVKSASVLVYGDNCVIAISTIGILTKTDHDQLVDRLTAVVREQYPQLNNIYITRNVKIYREIDRLQEMPAEQRNQELLQLLQKISQHPNTIPQLLGQE